jgi:hypothetical protein
MLRSIVPLVVSALLVTACADAPVGGDGSPSPAIGHGTAPDDLVLRWGYEGGFTPPEYQLTNLPAFSLYGDGTIVRPGPQIEIYPAPAVPALESVRVDEAGIQAILQAAFDADLDTTGDLTDMGSVGMADAPETVFTLRAGGVDRSVRVYALNKLGGRPPGMSGEEYEVRRTLLRLIGDLSDLERWLPEGSVATSTVYEPEGSRVFVSDYRGQPDLPQPEVAWPLAVALDTGEDTGTGFRCIAVTGPGWTDELAPVAAKANQLTPWTSGGVRYAVAFRPLLPDESAC